MPLRAADPAGKNGLWLNSSASDISMDWKTGKTMLRELTADMFISLDGFASGANEAAFLGYFDEGLGNWVNDHLHERHLLIIGRVTYESLVRFSSSATDGVSTRMSDLPKLVFSSTLKEPLGWKNTVLVKGSVADEVGALKKHPGDPLRTIGSMSLVKSMMQLGLVDRLRLIVFPVILGPAGREPIFAGYPWTGLELIDMKVLYSNFIVLEYRPGRPRSGNL
jgi:dihydrofolate reductase